ncbi:hypothetical protein [Roseateles sp. BYS87W]|uniref:PEP-CTERM protein-sorting domain-containing protein n=1 Tax=Pelomonas baiyunensis TaxID=3299026 RepID=A0ABW7H354_9BURK
MKKLLSALALFTSLAMGGAQAGVLPVLTATGLQDATGGWGTSFTKTADFTLDANTWVGGSLFTVGALGGSPFVDVQSVLLKQGNVQINWTETLGIDWSQFDGVEQWAMPTVNLSAGQWTLVVTGVTYADKLGDGVQASVELPEPQSLALAALALAGVGATRLRRRAD